MADEKKTETPAAPVLLTKDEAIAKLKLIKEQLKTFAGKPGFNPYTYMNKHIIPHEKTIAAGAYTPETAATITAMSSTVDDSHPDLRVVPANVSMKKEAQPSTQNSKAA